ncbi:hypothetical protein [Xanthovirga aplysinae]|uniref:hypothetical protein n=1 Tax=Xanthovirga aplysinae TaxID=2529853 RepID=UPI0012BD004C|nr:hypothetical protein [Xanthovirga aplysinae]MTI31039.1 hypothetical protein [Xanthovirga aplysinae]
MRKTQLLLFGLLLIGLQVWAQEPDREAMKKEMKEYCEKNIFPVLNEQRTKLDAYLYDHEKEKVDKIRMKLREMKQKAMEAKKEMKEKYKDKEVYEYSDEDKACFRAYLKMHRHLMQKAWCIVDNHEYQVYVLMDAMGEQHQKWHKDMKAIYHKYYPKCECKDKNHHHDKWMKHHWKMMKYKMAPVRFLLYDPKNPNPFEMHH